MSLIKQYCSSSTKKLEKQKNEVGVELDGQHSLPFAGFYN